MRWRPIHKGYHHQSGTNNHRNIHYMVPKVRLHSESNGIVFYSEKFRGIIHDQAHCYNS